MSSDHVSVAVHDLGGAGRPLLFSHATGFHGLCYLPIADRLADGFDCWGFDHRGHGSTPRGPDDSALWESYGDDALAVAERIAPDGGLIGFGHSMGATSLLMAADRRPGLFDLLVCFEPIVVPPDIEAERPRPLPIAEAARHRRESFESFGAAIENYASKPPMQAFDSDVLRLYVGHGFGAAPEGVRLKCSPAHEAATFEEGHVHGVWDRLPEVATPVVVLHGDDSMGPAVFAPRIGERLATGTVRRVEGSDHFGPFTDPGGMAELIRSLAAERGSAPA